MLKVYRCQFNSDCESGEGLVALNPQLSDDATAILRPRVHLAETNHNCSAVLNSVVNEIILVNAPGIRAMYGFLVRTE